MKLSDLLRACPLSAVLALAGAAGAADHPGGIGPAPRAVTWVGRTMGTYVRVSIVTPDSAANQARAARALAVFTRLDSLMSNWTTTSEVARVNRVAGREATEVHPEVARVIEKALEVHGASAGAFDITVEPLIRLWGFLGGKPAVPDSAAAAECARHVGARHLTWDAAHRSIRFADASDRIDLGGIAKGYAVDRAAESLVASGVTDALVDLSGNMLALGHPAGAEDWRIGIRDPRDRIPHFARLALAPGGISTSGKYEQFVSAGGRTYGHILDPRTGRPADGAISVTVLAPTAMDADAWSTALFVLGPEEAMRTARERSDLAAILVVPGEGGRDIVWVERALRHRFTLEPAAERIFEVRYF